MLYNRKTKQHFALDGEPMKPQAVGAVLRLQASAINDLAPSELAFEKAIRKMTRWCHVHFDRQVIFYVTASISFRSDYVFPKYRLIVEIDDPRHEEKCDADAWRDELLLEKCGMRTLRFTNKWIAEHPTRTMDAVIDALIESKSGSKKLLKKFRAYCERW